MGAPRSHAQGDELPDVRWQVKGKKVLIDGGTRQGVVVDETPTRVKVKAYHPREGTTTYWYDRTEVVVVGR